MSFQPTAAVPGMFFALQVETLAERLTARRETIGERVAKAVEMTPTDEPAVWRAPRSAKAISAPAETKGSDADD